MALLGSGCARCGQPYAAQGIRVLAQREEIAFVQLVCFACQIQTLALVTGVPAASQAADGGDDLAAAMPAGSPEDEARSVDPSWPAISDDDVLEMHAFLAGYDGDLTGLLDGGASADDDDPGRSG
jgi:hypothetical protein